MGSTNLTDNIKMKKIQINVREDDLILSRITLLSIVNDC